VLTPQRREGATKAHSEARCSSRCPDSTQRRALSAAGHQGEQHDRVGVHGEAQEGEGHGSAAKGHQATASPTKQRRSGTPSTKTKQEPADPAVPHALRHSEHVGEEAQALDRARAGQQPRTRAASLHLAAKRHR